MATAPPYKPFPYVGSQVILSSERIHLHARKDSVLLFARSTISLSSKDTIHLNSYGKTVVNSPRIELGLDANEQLVRGTTFMKELNDFCGSLRLAGIFEKSSGESDIAGTVSKLAVAANTMYEAAGKLQGALSGSLSTISYTR